MRGDLCVSSVVVSPPKAEAARVIVDVVQLLVGKTNRAKESRVFFSSLFLSLAAAKRESKQQATLFLSKFPPSSSSGLRSSPPSFRLRPRGSSPASFP